MSEQIFISEKDAYALIKKEQVSILKSRGVRISFRDKEKDLVKKLLDSNPTKEVEKVSEEELIEVVKEQPKEKAVTSGVKCLKCGSDMIKTGGGPSGTDFECIKCKFKLTKME